MNKKTVFTLVLIVFILSFFLTPMGHWGKVFLMRVFAPTPEIIAVAEREQLPNYKWQLKDANWDFFNFDISKGRVTFVKFWSSWNIKSTSELADIQELYDLYNEQVDFYIITDEERPIVELFMKENKFTFKLTYLIIGEPAPFVVPEPPAAYIIDKNGFIVVKENSNANWNNATIRELFDNLISE